MTPEDATLEIRLDELDLDRGPAAEFPYLEKSYQRRPTAQKQAQIAWCLYCGKNLGAPSGGQAEAIEMAGDACRKGSVRALVVLAFALGDGKAVAQDAGRAWAYALRAANAGDGWGMQMMGDYCRWNHAEPAAEYWSEQAAGRGWTSGLFMLAEDSEKGRLSGKPDLAKACALYLRAALCFNGDARARLAELSAQGVPSAQRDHSIEVLTRVCRQVRMPSAEVNASLAVLGRWSAFDPEVSCTLGRLYSDGFVMGFHDLRKAFQYFSVAANLGSHEARAIRADFYARGWVVTKDEVFALKEWRALEALNDGDAFADLGYYRFWGSLADAGWGKDPASCFYYSQRSASAGSPYGAYNLAQCYCDGIGTPKDYALAAVYFQKARYGAAMGYTRCRRLVDRCLAFVPD